MSAVNGSTGAVIYYMEGNELENLYGFSVCGLGDLDADGVGDFCVGAPKDNGGSVNGGRWLTYTGAVTDSCALALIGTPSAGSVIRIFHMAQPLTPVLLLADVSPGPVDLPPFGTFSLGFTPALTVLVDSAGVFGTFLGYPADAQGLLELGPLTVPVQLVGASLHLQSFGLTTSAPNGFFQRSNALPITFLP